MLIACINTANAWAIKLFCPPSGGLFLPSSSFIFEGLLEGWLEGWLESYWWFEGGLFLWLLSLSSSLSLSGDSFGELLLLMLYLIRYLESDCSCPLNILDDCIIRVYSKITFLFAEPWDLFLMKL